MKAIGVLCLLILTDLFAGGHAFDAANALYARYVCSFKPNGYKTLVPGSCSKFYECQFGHSKLRSCPRYFDGIQGMCVVTNPACVEELTAASDCSGPCCGVSSGYALDSTNSHDYYKCQDNNVIEEHQCLDDLVFNLLTLECDKAVNCVDATSSITPETVTPPPSTPPSSSASTNAPFDLDAYLSVVCLIKPDGFSFSSFTNCNEYYVCRGGQTVAENCGDLYFNSQRGICDLPQNTECYAMRNVRDTEGTSEGFSEAREGVTNLSPNASANLESENTVLISDEATPENHNESMYDLPNASSAIDSEKTASISEETSSNEQPKTEQNEDSTISNSPTNKPSNPEQSRIDQYLSVVCLAKPDWFQLVSFTSCHEFYVCRHGKAQLKSCGEKYFNADKNVCDFPENTQCLLDTYKKKTTFLLAPTFENKTPSKPSKAFRDPSASIPSNIDLYKRFVCRDKPNGELLVSLTQCNEFYICREGLAITKSCGRRYFNAARGICDLPKNTKCLLKQDQSEDATVHEEFPSSSSNPSASTSTNSIVAKDPSVKEFSQLDLYQRFVCRGKPEGELLVSLQSCHEYYVCHKGLAVSQNCGKLFFNAAKGICDLPENSKCFLHQRDETNDASSVSVNTEETTVLDISSTLPINSVDDSLTESTSSYEAVSHGKSYHHNAISQMDLYQRFVCRDKPNGEFLISLQSCNEFYVCHEGAAVVQSCGNQHFNSIKGICDSPKNSKCLLGKGAKVPQTSLDVSKTPAPSSSAQNLYQRFVCSDKPNGLILISPSNCNEYYICHEGLALKQSCGSHYFNYAKGSCDLPENTKCLLSKDQEELANDFFTIDSETPKAASVSNPDLYQRFVCRGKPDGLFLISLQSCQEYYICQEGLAVVQSCGQHYFNYAKGICDLPENTKCVLNDNDSMISSHSSPPNSQDPEKDPSTSTSTTTSSISLYQRFVCRGKPEGLLMISLNSCNEYYICREGIAIGKSCGRKYFNPSKGICDFPKNTKCILNEVQNN